MNYGKISDDEFWKFIERHGRYGSRHGWELVGPEKQRCLKCSWIIEKYINRGEKEYVLVCGSCAHVLGETEAESEKKEREKLTFAEQDLKRKEKDAKRRRKDRKDRQRKIDKAKKDEEGNKLRKEWDRKREEERKKIKKLKEEEEEAEKRFKEAIRKAEAARKSEEKQKKAKTQRRKKAAEELIREERKKIECFLKEDFFEAEAKWEKDIESVRKFSEVGDLDELEIFVEGERVENKSDLFLIIKKNHDLKSKASTPRGRTVKRIYVGNLPYIWGEEEVRELFSSYGEVYLVDLIHDRATGRPRGFGFVEMDMDCADAAIAALEGQEHGGRVLKVNEAYAKSRERDGLNQDSPVLSGRKVNLIHGHSGDLPIRPGQRYQVKSDPNWAKVGDYFYIGLQKFFITKVETRSVQELSREYENFGLASLEEYFREMQKKGVQLDGQGKVIASELNKQYTAYSFGPELEDLAPEDTDAGLTLLEAICASLPIEESTAHRTLLQYEKEYGGQRFGRRNAITGLQGWEYMGTSNAICSSDDSVCRERCLLERFRHDSVVFPKSSFDDLYKDVFFCLSCRHLFDADDYITDTSDANLVFYGGIPSDGRPPLDTSAYLALKRIGFDLSAQGQAEFDLPGWKVEVAKEALLPCRNCAVSMASLLRIEPTTGFIAERSYACNSCDRIYRSTGLGTIFVDPQLDKSSDEDITTLGEYHSWNRWKYSGSGLPWPEWSSKILDLKKKSQWVDGFCSQIDAMAQGEISIARVPSHDPVNTDSGIGRVAQSVAAKKNRTDATVCLGRVKKIKKVSAGGPRNTEVHFDSIEVVEREPIFLRNILLIDDVTTSGSSLKACRELLLRWGAKRVKMLALGKTVFA